MTASPPGLDLDALAAFLASRVGGVAGSLQAEVIPGGRSNLTYIVRDAERSYVVRRPPLAHVLPTAHDMRREYRVLEALRRTSIPVPPLLAHCEDESVIGAPFYVMEHVDGHVVREQLPSAYPDTAATRRDMSAALVVTLCAIHEVVPDEVGLGDFGHPQGFLARQVRRWWQQWEASKTRELAAIEELHRRLEETLPVASQPGIVHGDYRLDNVMFAPDDPSRIVAVLDWEMSTVGDPLCDVGLMLVYWSDDLAEPSARALNTRPITVQPGFLSRAELLQEYARRSSRDLACLDWYIGLGAYKLAIIAEGIRARFLMGMTVGEGFEGVGETVPQIVEFGLERTRSLARTLGG